MHDKPLKILMVLHMPWTRDLGGSRVQFELAEEFEKLGHTVLKFDVFDATPAVFRPLLRIPRVSKLIRCVLPKYCFQAKRFIQTHGSSFDVIDAHHGDLPFAKYLLSFEGALISRSVGLVPLYNSFEAACESRTSHEAPRPLDRIFSRLNSKHRISDSEAIRSMTFADAVIVPNEFEATFLKDKLPSPGRVQVVPFGLPVSTLENLGASKGKTPIPTSPRTAFIGTWERRKGSADWPSIVRNVRSRIPHASFCFLGTGRSEGQVKLNFAPEDRDSVYVTSNYASEELANLLAGSTVGAFPSYLEGFGYGVLEMIAAGLPVVSYDIPGPSSIIAPGRTGSLVPLGNVELMSSELVRLLSRSEQNIKVDSVNCSKHASEFGMPEIAARTLEVYRSVLVPSTCRRHISA